MNVLAANNKMEKPSNLQFSPSCGQFVSTADYVTKGIDFLLPGVLLKLSAQPFFLTTRCALPCSAMPLMFDLKAGIDPQFTGLCLIKVNTAMVVNCQSYQSPVKSFSTPSRLRGTAILMCPAQS